jgi:FkbM family methyltransferase
MYSLYQIFQDVFLFPCLLRDNYSREAVEYFDIKMMEGAYGYTDGDFDVTVKLDDVVIDAGAWIGDFSSYAAGKGAVAYAFEPVKANFDVLCETARLCNNQIKPVQMGLGDKAGSVEVAVSDEDSSGSYMFFSKSSKRETLKITTIDEFVRQERLERVDFIKSDIEGEERNLLIGAAQTLRKYAPKLAICTYHNPEDPQLLSEIIVKANPRYRIVHTHAKLFAIAK